MSRVSNQNGAGGGGMVRLALDLRKVSQRELRSVEANTKISLFCFVFVFGKSIAAPARCRVDCMGRVSL